MSPAGASSTPPPRPWRPAASWAAAVSSAGCLLLLGCSGHGAAVGKPEPAYHATWKMNSAYDRPIENPIQWAADNFADAPGADVAHMRTHELDLDRDGVNELLVWSRAMMGQAGGPYLAFRRSGDRYRYVGELGAGLYKVLPSGRDGRMRVAVYWRISAGEGILAILTNDGSRFIDLSTEKLRFPDGEEDSRASRRFRRVFGGGAYREGEPFR